MRRVYVGVKLVLVSMTNPPPRKFEELHARKPSPPSVPKDVEVLQGSAGQLGATVRVDPLAESSVFPSNV